MIDEHVISLKDNKKDFTFEVEGNDKDEFFKTFFRDYYGNLALEFPDRIVSNELEAVGEKALYEEWLNVISGKKVKMTLNPPPATSSVAFWIVSFRTAFRENLNTDLGDRK